MGEKHSLCSLTPSADSPPLRCSLTPSADSPTSPDPPPLRTQGACHTSSFRAEVLIPLICAVPLWCRFMQCLRIFHDSQKRFPALPNALKYSVSMLVVLFGEVRHAAAPLTHSPRERSPRARPSAPSPPSPRLDLRPPARGRQAHASLVAEAFGEESTMQWALHFAWIFIYMLATLYTFGWDVYMDWKLGRLNASLLRERRMFQYRSVYYAAIVLDFFLRFAWTATLVPHWLALISAEKITALWVLPIVSTLEMFRRAMWLVLRLESEHLHNTEGFRRVDVVPLHFDHAVGAKAQPTQDLGKTSRGWEMLIELLIYAGVVAILCVAAVSDLGSSSGDDGPPSSPRPA